MCVIEDKWDFIIDLHSLEKEYFVDFKQKFVTLQNNINKHFDNGLAADCVNNLTDIHDDELRVLIEKNKDIRTKIDIKLEELSQEQNKYECYKKDQKLLMQEIKETHEAFLMAKKCYKTNLKMYFTIEYGEDKQTVFVQFFTETKKDSNYSVNLLRTSSSGQYELISTTPTISSIKDAKKILEETNDVPGILYHIRQAFIDMTSKK